MTRQPTDEASRSSLIRRGGLVFSVRVTGAVLAYLTQVLLARNLGDDQLGEYVLAFAWCMIGSSIAGLGFPAASLKFLSETFANGRDDRARGYIRRSRLLVSISSTLCALLLAIVLPYFGYDEPAMTVALIALPLMALLRLHVGIAHAFSWFTIAFLPNIAVRPLLVFGAIAVALSLGKLDSAQDAMVLQLGAIVIVLVWQQMMVLPRLAKRFRGVTPTFETRKWVRTASPLLLIVLFTQYFADVNVILAGFQLERGELAVFNAALRTAVLIGFGIAAIDAVSLPALSKLNASRRRADLQEAVSRATRIKCVGAIVSWLGLAVLGEHILICFQPEFSRGYSALLVLAAAQVVRSLFGPVGELLSVTGHQDRCLKVHLVSLAVLAAAHATLTPSFGIMGAALAMLLTTAISSFWLHRIVVEELGVHPSILVGFPSSTDPGEDRRRN